MIQAITQIKPATKPIITAETGASNESRSLEKARCKYLESREEIAALQFELNDAHKRGDARHAQIIGQQIQAARIAHNALKRVFLTERAASLTERIGVAVMHLENMQMDLNAVRNELRTIAT